MLISATDWSLSNAMVGDAFLIEAETTGILLEVSQVRNDVYAVPVTLLIPFEKTLVELPNPFDGSRQLAFRLVPMQGYLPPFTVQIEVQPMPIFRNPGNITVSQQRSSSVTATEVAASTSVVALVAANASRLALSINNNSTGVLTIDFNSTVTAADSAFVLQPGDYFEAPVSYTGGIWGFWSNTNGNAQVREYIA